MDIDRFLSERRAGWDRLERLLDLAEHTSPQNLGHERVQELLSLYRRASSDLNQARSITANVEVIGRLNQLTGRGYRYVYRGGRSRLTLRAILRFATDEVPRTFRRERVHVLVSMATFALGIVFGLAAVYDDPDNLDVFVPEMFAPAVEDPAGRVAESEAGKESIEDVDTAAAFGAQLYTHNIQVTFVAFSMAALTLVGGWFVLFFNGAILGAVMAAYLQDDVGVFFFAWVGPHGSLELPAIAFSGAAGFKMGTALFFPGDRTRGAAVRAARPAGWRILGAAAGRRVAGGRLAGSFSQWSKNVVPYGVKIAVAVVLFTFLFAYLYLKPIARR